MAEAKQHLSAARDKAGDQINRLDMLETSGNDFPSRTLWEVLRAEIDVLSIVFAIITSLRSRSCSHPWSYKSVSSQLSHTEIREPMESLGASVGIQRMLRRSAYHLCPCYSLPDSFVDPGLEKDSPSEVVSFL